MLPLFCFSFFLLLPICPLASLSGPGCDPAVPSVYTQPALCGYLPKDAFLPSLPELALLKYTDTRAEHRNNLQKQHFDKRLGTSWKYSKYCHLLTVVFCRKGSHISHCFLIDCWVFFFLPQKSVEKKEGKHTNFTPAYLKTNYHDEFLDSKTSFHLSNL